MGVGGGSASESALKVDSLRKEKKNPIRLLVWFYSCQLPAVCSPVCLVLQLFYLLFVRLFSLSLARSSSC